jgi:hypothetical protein
MHLLLHLPMILLIAAIYTVPHWVEIIEMGNPISVYLFLMGDKLLGQILNLPGIGSSHVTLFGLKHITKLRQIGVLCVRIYYLIHVQAQLVCVICIYSSAQVDSNNVSTNNEAPSQNLGQC